MYCVFNTTLEIFEKDIVQVEFKNWSVKAIMLPCVFSRTSHQRSSSAFFREKNWIRREAAAVAAPRHCSRRAALALTLATAVCAFGWDWGELSAAACFFHLLLPQQIKKSLLSSSFLCPVHLSPGSQGSFVISVKYVGATPNAGCSELNQKGKNKKDSVEIRTHGYSAVHAKSFLAKLCPKIDSQWMRDHLICHDISLP